MITLGTGYTVGPKTTRLARLVCGDVAGPEAKLYADQALSLIV